MSLTAMATHARSEAIGGELASAEVVDSQEGDAVVRRGVGTTRGDSGVVGGGGVGQLADGTQCTKDETKL